MIDNQLQLRNSDLW